MCPARLEVRVATFTVARKTCLERALLEIERRHFNDETEIMFASSNEVVVMNLTKKDEATLALDPRAGWNPKVNNDDRFWLECKDDLQVFCRDHCIQTKAHNRQKKCNQQCCS